MATVGTTVKLEDPDRAYRMLIEAHRGLTDQQSAALNAKLILILVNEIGDLDVLRQAIMLARTSDAHSQR
jgi:hypothetical protein